MEFVVTYSHKFGACTLCKLMRKKSLVMFFLLGFTPCKAEKPLQGMELQKEAQKD